MISEADTRVPDIPLKKTSILIIVGLAIFIGYLYLVGFDSVKDILLKANLWYLGLAMAISLAANALHTAGWWMYLKDKGYRISFFKAYEIYLSSIFFVNLLPAVVGSGEVAKIYFVDKCTPDARFDKTLATCVISRALETLPIIAGAAFSVVYLAFFYDLPPWATAFCLFNTVMLTALVVVGIAAALNNALLRRLSDWAFRQLERLLKKDMTAYAQSIDEIITQFDASFREIVAKKKLMALSIMVMFAAWCLEISIAYVSFLAIGNPVNPVLVITVYSVLTVLQMMPMFLPGGLGVTDIVMTILYMVVGIPKAAASGATIMVRFVTLWFLTVVGGLATFYLAKAHGEKDLDDVKNSNDLRNG